MLYQSSRIFFFFWGGVLLFYNTALCKQSQHQNGASCFWHPEKVEVKRRNKATSMHEACKKLSALGHEECHPHRSHPDCPAMTLVAAHHSLKRRKHQVRRDLSSQRKELCLESMVRRFELEPKLMFFMINRTEL